VRLPLTRALLLLLGIVAAPAAHAHSSLPAAALQDLAFVPHPGARLPLDAALRDEHGRAVRLGDFFAGKPVLLVFDYFRCETLCGTVLEQLGGALGALDLEPGADYALVAVSIDPRETPDDAARMKREHLAQGPLAAHSAGLHFLVGTAPEVRRIADAAGFPYRYDAAIDQYAHPAGFIIAAPTGTIARYILGIAYRPLDLRLGLVEASRGTIAAPVAHALLLCYGYDPATGRYNLAVHRLLVITGVLTVAAIAALIAFAARGGARRPTVH
jgi:protein SCO1/2